MNSCTKLTKNVTFFFIGSGAGHIGPKYKWRNVWKDLSQSLAHWFNSTKIVFLRTTNLHVILFHLANYYYCRSAILLYHLSCTDSCSVSIASITGTVSITCLVPFVHLQYRISKCSSNVSDLCRRGQRWIFVSQPLKADAL